MTRLTEVPVTTARARLDLAIRALDGTLGTRAAGHPAWECFRPTCHICVHWRGRLIALEDRCDELRRQVERGDDERAHLPAVSAGPAA